MYFSFKREKKNEMRTRQIKQNKNEGTTKLEKQR